MRRDMDLIRDILVKLENLEESEFRGYFTVDGFEPKIVDYHLELLRGHGLVKGEYTLGDRKIWISLNLTYSGHDFLKSLSSETIWSKVKEGVKSKGMEIGQVPIEVLKEYAKYEFKKILGLDIN